MFGFNKKVETKEKAPINLEQIQLKDTSILEVVNPLTGEKSGATIELFNKYSSEYDLAQFEALKDVEFKAKKITVATGITKEIKGFFLDGKELTSSKEDIRKLYETCPMFVNDVDTHFTNIDNFFLNKKSN